jgi:hypothetical protein
VSSPADEAAQTPTGDGAVAAAAGAAAPPAKRPGILRSSLI